MNYQKHTNDHDYFSLDHAKQFLRNHKTGIDNFGRRRLGYIIDRYDNPKVLDVACGTCVNYECWKDMGIKHQYSGFDLTEQFLKIADEKYGDEVKLHHGFAQELATGFQSESFDIVLIRHFLEHVYKGEYQDIVKQAFSLASKELIIVFFLHPHSASDDIIEERSSNIPDKPEVTHYWNQYSWRRMQEFLLTLGAQIKTEVIATPGAAHSDFIVRLIK